MAIDSGNRWMPPSPHCERIIEDLETGRLTLKERGHGLPPVVVHEDGGHIDLPDIRWNGSRWKLAVRRQRVGVKRRTATFAVAVSRRRIPSR